MQERLWDVSGTATYRYNSVCFSFRLENVLHRSQILRLVNITSLLAVKSMWQLHLYGYRVYIYIYMYMYYVHDCTFSFIRTAKCIVLPMV